MKRGPIGVWFSVALTIFVLSVWMGSKLGTEFAVYQYRRQQQEQGTLSAAERARVNLVLSELESIQTLRTYALATRDDKKLNKTCLLDEISELENLEHKADAQQMRPAVNLDLGLAYVDASMAEQQDNNRELAAGYMKSAQSLFQSLGWHDYSEETLRHVAKAELDRVSPKARKEEPGK